VHQALEAGIRVVAVPGPTALIAALAVSGLATHPFAFLGFPPARGSTRRRFFAAHAGLVMTLILYEAPTRLLRTLQDLLEAWGNRSVCVARELTKRYEECFRGTLAEAVAHFAAGAIRGEITLVVAGADLAAAPADDSGDWVAELAELLRQPAASVKDATRAIAQRHGIAKKFVYQRAIELTRPRP
jgi:16S rRNA (cytidine1402-2'-O)-methyltransferase